MNNAHIAKMDGMPYAIKVFPVSLTKSNNGHTPQTMNEPNWKNRTIWTGDNLDIMRGMNSASVDLIYLDPPFKSNRNYAAPIGSKAAGAAFKDTWTLSDVDHAWHGEIAEELPPLYSVIAAAGLAHGKGMKSYLIMMAVRLLEMKRLLKETGSIYLHCDPTASHYLKVLMDVVFGKNNFRNEIVWSYKKVANSKAKKFLRAHDTILFYSASDSYDYNPTYDSTLSPRKEQLVRAGYNTKNMNGLRYIYVYDDSVLSRKEQEGKIDRNDFDVIRYVDTTQGNRHTDVFSINFLNSQSKENVGYPTQKPVALLERIIRASSNPGDVVLDPFCGCATTCVVADRIERQWIGIDLSPMAVKLVLDRIRQDRGPIFNDVIHREDFPQRTDLGKLPHYKTHKHTLFGIQEGICAGCETMYEFRNFTIDHIVPRSKGGSDHIDNLQLLCGNCNSKKGIRSQEEFLAGLIAAGYRSRPDVQ